MTVVKIFSVFQMNVGEKNSCYLFLAAHLASSVNVVMSLIGIVGINSAK